MKPLWKIAIVAAAMLAFAAGTTLANTNTPTVQPQHHWKSQASTTGPAPRNVTIGVFSHGRGVGAKHSSPRWR